MIKISVRLTITVQSSGAQRLLDHPVYRCVLLRIRNASDKICRENQNTDFIFNKFSPKIVRDNVEELGTARYSSGDKNHAKKKVWFKIRLRQEHGRTHNFNTYLNITHDTVPLSWTVCYPYFPQKPIRLPICRSQNTMVPALVQPHVSTGSPF